MKTFHDRIKMVSIQIFPSNYEFIVFHNSELQFWDINLQFREENCELWDINSEMQEIKSDLCFLFNGVEHCEM